MLLRWFYWWWCCLLLVLLLVLLSSSRCHEGLDTGLWTRRESVSRSRSCIGHGGRRLRLSVRLGWGIWLVPRRSGAILPGLLWRRSLLLLSSRWSIPDVAQADVRLLARLASATGEAAWSGRGAGDGG